MTDPNTEARGRSPRAVLRSPTGFLALGFGAGLSPVAPGTAGTLVAVPLAWALQQMPPWSAWAVVLAMVLAGVWICQRAALALQMEDPAAVVWDEIAAFCLVAVLIPEGWTWLLAAFLLFRAFDILKPWPVAWLEKTLGGGLGIMADDIAAALYSVAALRLAELLLAGGR